MRILAIDTGTRRGSVALVDGARVLGAAWLDDTHGRALAPRVAALLAAEGGLAAVQGITLSIGPGSFTGLRIGLAFVKGLVLATPRPVLPVSTLALLAYGRGEGGPVLAAIDARNGEVFVRLEGLLPDGLRRVDELPALLPHAGSIVGEPPPALLERLPGWTALEPSAEPLAVALAALARGPLEAGEGRDPAALQPSYGQVPAVDRPRAVVDTPASHS
jgi:tRNA threonylcarbamoyladenosine biosynthesis protein TsaB